MGPDPDLVDTTGIDVDAVADGMSRLGRVLVLGVGDGELAADDQVSRQAVMAVRAVVCIAAHCHERSASQPHLSLSPLLFLSIGLSIGF